MPLKMQPLSTIKVQLGINDNGRVIKYLTNECKKAMDKYVPFDKGDLARESYIEDGHIIVYEMPYAIYQYRGIREDGTHQINPANRNRSMHPLATSYWDKKMWTAEGSRIVKKVQEHFGGK